MKHHTSPLPLSGPQRMAYETPPEGISLTGYVARRLHKTVLLDNIQKIVQHSPTEALARFGFYAAASSTSYGPTHYQPRFDRPGTRVHADDPQTGARVMVHHISHHPHYTFEYCVTLPDGGEIEGTEVITETTISLHGLGMPAPSLFEFAYAHYTAQASGIICSELAPRLWQPWQIRGYGQLQLADNNGNSGHIMLDREGHIKAHIQTKNGQSQYYHLKLTSHD